MLRWQVPTLVVERLLSDVMAADVMVGVMDLVCADYPTMFGWGLGASTANTPGAFVFKVSSTGVRNASPLVWSQKVCFLVQSLCGLWLRQRPHSYSCVWWRLRRRS